MGELDGPLSREDAVRWLSLALEAVVENYAEYVDYNSTTTQSDRGEMLYTLWTICGCGRATIAWRGTCSRCSWPTRPWFGPDATARPEIWRSAVAERTAEIAEEHLKRFARLNRRYGMRLPSIAERLGERFVRPLQVDRLCALVRPAMKELQSGRSDGSPRGAANGFSTSAQGSLPEPRLIGRVRPGRRRRPSSGWRRESPNSPRT